MDKTDFKDPQGRAEYFRFSDGRPTDLEIISAIREMVAFVGPHALPGDGFISNDMCLSIWDKYANQHRYIGYHVSRMEEAGELPIRRIDTVRKRAVYSIA